MRRNLDKIFEYVVGSEGRYTDDQHDPGGPTNWGVTHIDLARWLGKKSVTKDEVRNMSRETAMRIYEEWYWKPVSGDELPDGVDYQLFDFGLNAGVSKAIEKAQVVVGAVADKKMGRITLAALEDYNPRLFVVQYCDQRVAFYKQLPTYWKFGKGWLNRTYRSKTESLGLIDAAEKAPEKATETIVIPTAPPVPAKPPAPVSMAPVGFPALSKSPQVRWTLVPGYITTYKNLEGNAKTVAEPAGPETTTYQPKVW